MTDIARNWPETEVKEKAPEPKILEEAKVPPTSPHEWWPFDSMRRDFERLFGDFYRDPWRIPFARSAFDVAPAWPGGFLSGSVPAVDITENEQAYMIAAEMPGVSPGDVQVSMSEGRLVIQGEKKDEREEERKGYHHSERRYGSLQRSFRIPEDVDAENISASFKDGVLTVTLPRIARPPEAVRKIDVKAAQ